MRKNTSERRKAQKEKDSLRTNEENLNESDIDENTMRHIEAEIEEEYMDFPDPLEYLIGFFAAKSEPSYKYHTTSYKHKSSHISASANKKKPPVINNYTQEKEPKILYKSYYDAKKPSEPDNLMLDLNSTLNSVSKAKYRENAALSNSYEKPSSSLHHKHHIVYPEKYSKTIDEDDRLCRTLGEEQLMESRHESIGRSSINQPSYDPYKSSRSYGFEHSSSKSKDGTSYLSTNLYKMATISSTK